MVKENCAKKESGSFLVRQRETLGKTGSHTSSIRARVETSLRSELSAYRCTKKSTLIWLVNSPTSCCYISIEMADSDEERSRSRDKFPRERSDYRGSDRNRSRSDVERGATTTRRAEGEAVTSLKVIAGATTVAYS